MKKLLLSLITLLGVIGFAQAKDSYSHDVKVLPVAAQNILSQNFKSKVSLIKIDKTVGYVEDYEVILTDGSEVKFDRHGNWKEIETSLTKSVPSSLVPQAIQSYVTSNYKKTRIVGIEKERHGYEVTLSNGIEMKFDPNGKFIKFD